MQVRGVLDVLRHHRAEGEGFELSRTVTGLSGFKTAAIGH
jgi:hypothetical protein